LGLVIWLEDPWGSFNPGEKKLLKGWQFKPMFAIEAEPEVKAWN
jgi:hypothetical protein